MGLLKDRREDAGEIEVVVFLDLLISRWCSRIKE